MIIIKAILSVFTSVILFTIIVCDGQNLFLTNLKQAYPVASKCIKSIVQKSFPCGTLITLVNTRMNINRLISNLSEDDCYSFIVRRYDNDNRQVPSEVNILMADNALDFSNNMPNLTSDIFWNPKSHNIIHLEQLDEERDIRNVFDVLLRLNVFSALLVKRLSSTKVILYTYYPFNNTNCGLKYDYSNVSNCEDSFSYYFSNEHFSLKNCNLSVIAIKNSPNFIYEEYDLNESGGKISGLEQFLLETIAEKEGIIVQYTLVPRDFGVGVVLSNNTATGLLSFLQKDEMDIAAGGIILIKNRIDMFDYIWGYNYATVNLFTPAVGEEIWKDVYKEFGLKTWILIALAYCTITVIFTVVRRWKSKILRKHAYLSLKLWGYLYMNTCKKLSKEKDLRIFMVFWIWFTFFICNFYNTALYSLLTGRDQIKRLISIDDLRDLPFEPCTSEHTRTYFLFAMNQTIPKGRDIPDCHDSDTALAYVASGNNAYAIEMEYIYAMTEHRYLDEDGHSKLDAWSFSSNNVICMYLTRGFPMTQEFQNYAWNLYESGILKQHLTKLAKNHNAKKQPHKRHFKKMLLCDLRIHFLILLVGSMVSVLCFIIELISFRK